MFRVIKKRTGHIRGYYHAPAAGNHRQEIILFLFFAAGLIIGALTIKRSSLIQDRLLPLFQSYYTVRTAQSAAANFCTSFFVQIIVLLGVFCLGLCAVGNPFLYLIPLSCGAATGLVSAFLYRSYMLKGIGYCALILYPGRILFVIALILCGSVGTAMSRKLMHNLIKSDSSEQTDFRKYATVFLIAAALCAGASALDTALFSLFCEYFQFS